MQHSLLWYVVHLSMMFTLCICVANIVLYLAGLGLITILNDDEVAAILADMRDSQTPAISPIKSPKKRGSSDSEEEIPPSQPP